MNVWWYVKLFAVAIILFGGPAVPILLWVYLVFAVSDWMLVLFPVAAATGAYILALSKAFGDRVLEDD